VNDSISSTSQEKSNEQVDEQAKSSTENKPLLLSIKEEIIESDQEPIEKAKTESNYSAKRVDAKSSSEDNSTSNQTSSETQDEKTNNRKKSLNKSNYSTESLEIANSNNNSDSPQQTKSDSQLHETPNNGRRSSLRLNSTEQVSKQTDKNTSRRNSIDTNNQANTASVTPTVVINSKCDETSPNLPTNESLNKLTTTNPTQPESKYSFHVINSNLIGKQRIKQIEEQMKLCREAYTKLKMEIAAIDRKKKKLYQQRKEKSNTEDSSTVAFT